MSITVNKKAFHDFFVEEKYEAGIALQGWEVKAIRAGRMNIKESYVIIKGGEIFLIGMHITPLATASRRSSCRAAMMPKGTGRPLTGKLSTARWVLAP